MICQNQGLADVYFLLFYPTNKRRWKGCILWVRPMKISAAAELCGPVFFKIHFHRHIMKYTFDFILGCVCVERAACVKFADRCLLHVKIVISTTAKTLCQSKMPL